MIMRTMETKNLKEPGKLMEPEKPKKQKRTMKHAKSNELKKVFICSPFTPHGKTEEEMEKDLIKNIDVANHACRFAVEKGYIPHAPHLYFTQFLSNEDQEERDMGIVFGLTWLARCDELWVFGEEITEGMALEISVAEEWNIPIRRFVHKKSGEEKRKVVISVRFDDGDCDEGDEFEEFQDFDVYEGPDDLFEGEDDFDDDPSDPSEYEVCSDCIFRDSCLNMN